MELQPAGEPPCAGAFSYEGIFRQHMIIKDRNRDTAWFAVMDHEWPARKAVFEKWLYEEVSTPGDG